MASARSCSPAAARLWAARTRVTAGSGLVCSARSKALSAASSWRSGQPRASELEVGQRPVGPVPDDALHGGGGGGELAPRALDDGKPQAGLRGLGIALDDPGEQRLRLVGLPQLELDQPLQQQARGHGRAGPPAPRSSTGSAAAGRPASFKIWARRYLASMSRPSERLSASWISASAAGSCRCPTARAPDRGAPRPRSGLAATALRNQPSAFFGSRASSASWPRRSITITRPGSSRRDSV